MFSIKGYMRLLFSLFFLIASCDGPVVLREHTCRWKVLRFAGAIDNYGLYVMECNHGYKTDNYTLLYSLKEKVTLFQGNMRLYAKDW